MVAVDGGVDEMLLRIEQQESEWDSWSYAIDQIRRPVRSKKAFMMRTAVEGEPPHGDPESSQQERHSDHDRVPPGVPQRDLRTCSGDIHCRSREQA